jgi:NhaP-type Na+/H+ or K+/H+ antiporter
MKNEKKLILIKIIHTVVWIMFNIVIFYMLYAAITGKLDKWLWIGYGIILLETIILIAFRFYCPLTIIARQYSDSTEENFDIYLPKWLAKYNKQVYTTILVVIIILTIYQVF